MPTRVVKSTFVAVLLAFALSAMPADAASRARVYVRIGPPAPVVEVRPVAPGPRYVWADGYHRWDGQAYAWVPGHWVVPPRPHAVWVPGHWAHGRRGWYFVEGRWR